MGSNTIPLRHLVVHRIKAGEYIATKVGPGGKLDKERKEHVVATLLIRVPKTKVEIRNGSSSCVAQGHDILYDCGASQLCRFYQVE